jgi:hypothetical protein
MRTLSADQCTLFNIHRSVLNGIIKLSEKKLIEEIKTHILNSFFKLCRLWDKVEKYCTAWQGTDYNMAHAHCMLDTEGYKHTLKVCYTYYLFTATMVARTHLLVTHYVHCLPCFGIELCHLEYSINFCMIHSLKYNSNEKFCLKILMPIFMASDSNRAIIYTYLRMFSN